MGNPKSKLFVVVVLGIWICRSLDFERRCAASRLEGSDGIGLVGGAGNSGP